MHRSGASRSAGAGLGPCVSGTIWSQGNGDWAHGGDRVQYCDTWTASTFSVSLAPHYKPGTPMKTARFLLACALVSLLAACGGKGITAPDSAAPGRPHFDEDPSLGGGQSTQDTGSGSGNCIIIIVVNPDGSITQQ